MWIGTQVDSERENHRVAPLWHFTSLTWGISSRFPLGVHGGSEGEKSACNVGDLGSIPGLERAPGGGRGNPLQYSSLDYTAHGVASVGHHWATSTCTSLWPIILVCLVHRPNTVYLRVLPCVHTHLSAKVDPTEEVSGRSTSLNITPLWLQETFLHMCGLGVSWLQEWEITDLSRAQPPPLIALLFCLGVSVNRERISNCFTGAGGWGWGTHLPPAST